MGITEKLVARKLEKFILRGLVSVELREVIMALYEAGALTVIDKVKLLNELEDLTNEKC